MCVYFLVCVCPNNPAVELRYIFCVYLDQSRGRGNQKWMVVVADYVEKVAYKTSNRINSNIVDGHNSINIIIINVITKAVLLFRSYLY